MNYSLYLSALTLGFLGSFHCAGMCGPIALMLPAKKNQSSAAVTGKLLYNSGRILTYMLLGALFGSLGLSLVLKGFQKELSVLTGVVILVIITLTAGNKAKAKMYQATAAFTRPLKMKLKKLFTFSSGVSLFFIGVLNGLLPCGFVYLATAGAVSTGSISGGMLYMALFGLGTFPVMMLLTLTAQYLNRSWQKAINRITPFAGIALALFLIYRGTDMRTETGCHEPQRMPVVIPCEKPLVNAEKSRL
jgi:sulfite exporter TauE/SafE